MTRVRRRGAIVELFVPWIIAAIMLTLAWFTFQLQSVADKPARIVPAPATSQRASTPATVLLDADVVELRRRRLPIPVQGVNASSLVSSFHQTRGGNREHEALDILAPRGTPAVAVEESRVEKLFTSERGGLTAYLFDMSGTYCYYYAHQDSNADDQK